MLLHVSTLCFEGFALGPDDPEGVMIRAFLTGPSIARERYSRVKSAFCERALSEISTPCRYSFRFWRGRNVMWRPLGRSPGRIQLLRAIDEIETDLRAIGSRWSDHLPAEARYELLQLANKLWSLLQRAGLR